VNVSRARSYLDGQGKTGDKVTGARPGRNKQPHAVSRTAGPSEELSQEIAAARSNRRGTHSAVRPQYSCLVAIYLQREVRSNPPTLGANHAAMSPSMNVSGTPTRAHPRAARNKVCVLLRRRSGRESQLLLSVPASRIDKGWSPSGFRFDDTRSEVTASSHVTIAGLESAHHT
jgi:hypothetical protein